MGWPSTRGIRCRRRAQLLVRRRVSCAPVRHVALLRGIGPGNPKMRNAVLLDVLQRAGLDDVTAVISSGNYLFSATERDRRRLEERIEHALLGHLGAPCTAIVRSRRQIDGIAGLDVFDGFDDSPVERCNVTFLQRGARAGAKVPTHGDGYRIVAIRRQCIFFTVDAQRQKTPEIMRLLETGYGRAITTRTWRTVHRIARALDG